MLFPEVCVNQRRYILHFLTCASYYVLYFHSLRNSASTHLNVWAVLHLMELISNVESCGLRQELVQWDEHENDYFSAKLRNGRLLSSRWCNVNGTGVHFENCTRGSFIHTRKKETAKCYGSDAMNHCIFFIMNCWLHETAMDYCKIYYFAYMTASYNFLPLIISRSISTSSSF